MTSGKPIEVWMHKKTGKLYEHLPTCLGYALASVDIENTEFTNWYDWRERGLFYFNDEKFYNPKNFENLGEL